MKSNIGLTIVYLDSSLAKGRVVSKKYLAFLVFGDGITSFLLLGLKLQLIPMVYIYFCRSAETIMG